MGLLDEAIAKQNRETEQKAASEAANLAWNLKFSIGALVGDPTAHVYTLDPTEALRSTDLLARGEQEVIDDVRARLDQMAGSPGFIIPTPQGTEVFRDRLEFETIAASRTNGMVLQDPQVLHQMSLVNSNAAAAGRPARCFRLFHRHDYYTSYSISLVFDDIDSFYTGRTNIGYESQAAQHLAAAAAGDFV